MPLRRFQLRFEVRTTGGSDGIAPDYLIALLITAGTLDKQYGELPLRLAVCRPRRIALGRTNSLGPFP